MSIPKVGDYYVLNIPEQNMKSVLMVTATFIRGLDVEIETLMYYPQYNRFSFKDWETDLFEKEYVAKANENDVIEFKNAKLNDNEFKDVFIFTEEYLQEEAARLVEKHWGIDEKPIIVMDFSESVELQSGLMGGACFNTRGKFIEFWSEINRQMEHQEVLDMLLHELCHWYLFITGEEYRDNDVRFVKELIKLGIGHTHNSSNKEAAKAYKIALKEMNSL
ncbi:hypothetical protein L8C07_05560 [Paenibacillus sp. CMAA1739]|uniref:hypothetical protein n=1 Tax=Paenibacillus ottowii TaxID=2315729 RepID=UPI002DBE2AA8|nr:hypothetical protein [Paenibacillus sp. CMAA1739]MEC4565405.1 hypothetical protein [Paenibacillus sp. CMAA1739]